MEGKQSLQPSPNHSQEWSRVVCWWDDMPVNSLNSRRLMIYLAWASFMILLHLTDWTERPSCLSDRLISLQSNKRSKPNCNVVLCIKKTLQKSRSSVKPQQVLYDCISYSPWSLSQQPPAVGTGIRSSFQNIPSQEFLLLINLTNKTFSQTLRGTCCWNLSDNVVPVFSFVTEGLQSQKPNPGL